MAAFNMGTALSASCVYVYVSLLIENYSFIVLLLLIIIVITINSTTNSKSAHCLAMLLKGDLSLYKYNIASWSSKQHCVSFGPKIQHLLK